MILHDPATGVSVRVEYNSYGQLELTIKGAEKSPCISYNGQALRVSGPTQVPPQSIAS